MRFTILHITASLNSSNKSARHLYPTHLHLTPRAFIRIEASASPLHVGHIWWKQPTGNRLKISLRLFFSCADGEITL